MSEKEKIFYNDERYRYDIEIPPDVQAKLLYYVISLKPDEIIKKKHSPVREVNYCSTSSYFTYKISSYYQENNNMAVINMLINNKKEKIVYEVYLTVTFTGSNYGWDLQGYAQDKLFFFEELFQKYILTLNNPALFI